MKERGALRKRSQEHLKVITDRYGAGLMINSLVGMRMRQRQDGTDTEETDALILRLLDALDISAGRKK